MINEKFKVDQFEKIGKGQDYEFQIICFLQTAASELSLARTITVERYGYDSEVSAKIAQIQHLNYEVQKMIREGKK